MGFEGLNNNIQSKEVKPIDEYVMIADEYSSLEELNNIWIKYILQPYDKQCESDKDCKYKYGKSVREQYDLLYKDISSRISIDPINESTNIDNNYIRSISKNNINSLNDLPMFTPDMMNEYKDYYSKSTTNDWQESYQLLSLGCIAEDYFELNKKRLNTLTELYRQYPFKNDEIKQKVLDLGWNPEVDFSPSNRIKATENTRMRLNKSLYINELYDATELLREKYMFSDDNLYINFDKFENGKSNICLVTGLSGSGKSTLAKELSNKYKAEYIELDNFEWIMNISEKDWNTPLRAFIQENPEIYEYIKEGKLKSDTKVLCDILRKFISFTISFCNNDKKHKYIIEGVQIYTLGDENQIKGKPIVLINASCVKSILQRTKRNKENGSNIELKNIPNILSWYIDNEKQYKNFKNNILRENYMFSDDNLYINFDKFENGKSNMVFITGLSGSGKSTLGKKISDKFDAEYVELDTLSFLGSCDISKVKGTIFERYVNENKKDYEYLVKNKPNSFEVPDEIIKRYVSWMIKECSNDKKNKYVLEGVQFYSHGDPNMIKNKPIIFVNASVIKSMMQRHKRNKSYNVSLKDELKELPDMLKYYLTDERQYKKFKNQVLSEQTIVKNNKVKDKNPIHVILVYTGSPFGKAIKTYTKGIYTHAAMSIDNAFDKLYSYNLTNNFNKLGGFSIESIEGYKNSNKDALLCIYTTFVSDKQLDKLKKQLNDFTNNVDKTKYSVLNVFTLLLNKPVELSNDMICSQFVSRMFKSINIDISGKYDSLTTPNDIYRYNNSNKMFKTFEGKISDFNIKNIIKKINKLQLTSIVEQKSSIQFDKEGNLIINKPNDIEREYNKSHKLLMAYEKTNNYEAMKEELYKLWFLNIQLEKIIYKQRKNNKEYVDMRARILNDFTKYLKIVNMNEPEFVFTKEYEKSKYNDTNFVIDKSTMKHGINYGKQLFKFLNLPLL